MGQRRYRAVVIGSSLGGVEALQVVLSGLRTVPPVPVLIAHHVGPSGSVLDRVLHRYSRLPVEWARDGPAARPGTVYLCPPSRQLGLEPDGTLAARPHLRHTSVGTVDHLFTSASAAFGDRVLAIVLSGTGRDGLDGARAVKDAGGTVLVQDELTSIAFGMPGAVVAAGLADLVLPLAEIPHVLDQLVGGGARLPVSERVFLRAAFAAGGEMGAAIAGTDWSGTELGPPDRWPQALCGAVTTVLGSRLAMLLCWGPEFLAIYNDAYRTLLGDRDAGLLGRPVLRADPDRASTLGPMLNAVLAGGEGLVEHDRPFPLLRGGEARERFCSVGLSPLRDGAAVSGLLGTFTDVTVQVQATRRLRTLHRLARAADVPPPRGPSVPSGEVCACERAAAVLGENGDDVPFALVYLTDRTGTRFHLAATAGLPAGDKGAAPTSGREVAEWSKAAAHGRLEARLVEDVRQRFPGLPPGVAGRALVLPAGRRADGTSPVVLVAGLSPIIELDGAYHDFLELVAAQVGASVLAASPR